VTAGNPGTPEEQSSGAPFHFEDKRRIDPETGEPRVPAGDSQAAGPDDGIDHLDFTPDAAVSGDGGAADDGDALAAAQARAAELLDDLQRERASFTNYRNRALRDQEAARARGTEDVLLGLLPVLDDIERARSHGELEGPLLAIAEKLDGALGRFGVQRYGAVGDEFDPAVHEALMHQPDDSASTVTVQAVIEPGYRIGEKIVRAARVAVVGPQG